MFGRYTIKSVMKLRFDAMHILKIVLIEVGQSKEWLVILSSTLVVIECSGACSSDLENDHHVYFFDTCSPFNASFIPPPPIIQNTVKPRYWPLSRYTYNLRLAHLLHPVQNQAQHLHHHPIIRNYILDYDKTLSLNLP